MTSRKQENFGTKALAKKIPTSEILASLALDGLFSRFSCHNEWISYRRNPAGDPPDSVQHTCTDLIAAAEDIGKAIRAEPAPNNQFALYNLAIARQLGLFVPDASEGGGARATEVAVGQPKLNRMTEAISSLINEVTDIAAHLKNEPTDNSANHSSTLRKYFTREHDRMDVNAHYGFILFFLVSLAAQVRYPFEKDKVLVGSPAVLDIYREAKRVLDGDDATPNLIRDKVSEALARGRLKYQSRVFLGGLLEIGATDIAHLWRPLFNKDPKDHDRLSAGGSAEAHYIAYRLTSSERDVEVMKSFVVFQAPGYTPGGGGRREHFAIKAFTRYGSDMMRSVGAVVGLGDQIVCFASRRKMPDGRDPTLLQPSDFRGATMLIFNKEWFDVGVSEVPGFLAGMLMTTNQYSRNAACPIICLRTDHPHSDLAKLRIIGQDDLVADMLHHTRLVANENPAPQRLGEYIWDELLLARPHEAVKPASVGTTASGCTRCPPIVANSLKPRDVGKAFKRFGYSMKVDPVPGRDAVHQGH